MGPEHHQQHHHLSNAGCDPSPSPSDLEKRYLNINFGEMLQTDNSTPWLDSSEWKPLIPESRPREWPYPLSLLSQACWLVLLSVLFSLPWGFFSRRVCLVVIEVYGHETGTNGTYKGRFRGDTLSLLANKCFHFCRIWFQAACLRQWLEVESEVTPVFQKPPACLSLLKPACSYPS